MGDLDSSVVDHPLSRCLHNHTVDLVHCVKPPDPRKARFFGSNQRRSFYTLVKDEVPIGFPKAMVSLKA